MASSRRPTAPRHAPAGRRRGRRCPRSLAANAGSVESLKVRTRCGCRPCAAQIRCTERRRDAAAARPSRGRSSGSPRRAARRRSARPPARPRPAASGGMPGLAGSCRAAARRRPPRTNRSCQRQTQGLDTPGPAHDLRRAAARRPSARTIRARQTCFCGLLRSATIASSRARSAALTSMLIPSRMPQHATLPTQRESYDCVRPLAPAAARSDGSTLRAGPAG